MPRENREEFLKILERAAAQTGFPQNLLEKDYYLTLLLSKLGALSGKLLFKGGTALSKVHFSYYRLSEDLDFTLELPKGLITRTVRSAAFKPIKAKIQPWAESCGMAVESEAAGHRESSQYIFHLHYDSATLPGRQSVKIEIGLRFHPLMPPETGKVHHKFLHPFTQEPLFNGGEVRCLNLKEMVAEKTRAAATRLGIAPRDFYDLGYLLKAGFDFEDGEFLRLFKAKLAEDGFDTDLKKYRSNLGRPDKEIAHMKSRVKVELLDVLTQAERRIFDMGKTLEALNKAFAELS